MGRPFGVFATQGFKRDARRATKHNPGLAALITQAIDLLELDPLNVERRCDIRKLGGMKSGEGRWRLRLGDYRIRYDVLERSVALYSFRHRKDAY